MPRQVSTVLRCTLPIPAGYAERRTAAGAQKFISDRVTTSRGNPSRLN